MKKFFLITAAVITSFLSCRKDVDQKPVEPDKLVVPDKIVYVGNVPDGRVKTILSYMSTQNTPCIGIPVPRDSTAICKLDLDGDSEIDFEITVRHYQDTTCFPYPCFMTYRKQILIKPTLSSNWISLDTISKTIPSTILKNYKETEAVLAKDAWTQKETYAFVETGCYGVVADSFTWPYSYWGLKFKNQLAWIKIRRIEIHGVEVLEWGYNKTIGKSIKAGQKN